MFQAVNEGGVNRQDFVEVDAILCLKCGYLSKIFLGWTIKTNQSNIPSIKWQSTDILLSYSTVGNPHVGVWCHAIDFYMITANGIVRGIDESSSDAEFKENSSQKVIICSLWLL